MIFDFIGNKLSVISWMLRAFEVMWVSWPVLRLPRGVAVTLDKMGTSATQDLGPEACRSFILQPVFNLICRILREEFWS